MLNLYKKFLCRRRILYLKQHIFKLFINTNILRSKLNYWNENKLSKLQNENVNPLIYFVPFLNLFRNNIVPVNAINKAFTDINNNILKLIEQSKECMKNSKNTEAKAILHQALRISEHHQVYENASQIYDLLVLVALREGSIAEAEELIVRFIEKLTEIGYAEDHNSIIRFKLKLCRLNQIMGNNDMADIGYRSCIESQEGKLKKHVQENKPIDVDTKMLYLTSLFWYGRFLSEEESFGRAEIFMKKGLDYDKSHDILEPSQLMVYLYYTAEVSFRLLKYQESINYLVRAIEIATTKDSKNPDLAAYVTKLGVVFLFMGVNDEALYWCTQGKHLSKQYSHNRAEVEAQFCLDKLQEIKEKK